MQRRINNSKKLTQTKACVSGNRLESVCVCACACVRGAGEEAPQLLSSRLNFSVQPPGTDPATCQIHPIFSPGKPGCARVRVRACARASRQLCYCAAAPGPGAVCAACGPQIKALNETLSCSQCPLCLLTRRWVGHSGRI